MLFHSSIRKELGRSFGATLVVLFTIVITMLLIRTLGLASKGSVNPEEVMIVLGYTVLGRLPTILTIALFISIVSTLSRMHSDSEMVIWYTSGRGLMGFLSPVLRFAWPILLAVGVLVMLVWPWANEQIDLLRDRFEQRSDLQRVAPGQFQSSSDGRRVFFIDKDSAGTADGRNVFISNQEDDGSESITSARSGRVERVDGRQMLLLSSGQRLDVPPPDSDKPVRVSEFAEYGIQIGEEHPLIGADRGVKSMPTWELLGNGDRQRSGELVWRIGMLLTAINFVLIAVSVSSANPRAGRGGNLAFVLFAFVFYYNLLNLSQSWLVSGRLGFWQVMLGLHGVVLVLAAGWMLKRHHNWTLRDLLPAPTPAGGTTP
ncbi:LPS export ABC transporter permease LptF [Hydrogenophaga sp. OTU3427]|uniref:LPS export ABC transporter permease LptF n=1 Tax=Hydrogenophaga sp. OTU3427 TaxID=3043856 RepID=UPI00313F3018